MPLIERAILSRSPQSSDGPSTFTDELGRTGSYQSRAVFPVMRGSTRTCITILDLDASEPDHFKDRATAYYEFLSPLLNLTQFVYDWRFRRTLSEEIQDPIVYDQTEHGFYEQVEGFIALSSQMEFAVLREYAPETDSLYTLAKYGFDLDSSQDQSLDVQNANQFSPFHFVIQNRKPITFHDAFHPDQSPLRLPEVDGGVRSFVVCPVLVGHELFGLLSFGSSVEYHYSHDEIVGLQSIANGVGVSILNFRHFHQANLQVAKFERIGTAITALEVAQAARHEARGILQNAREANLLARRLLGSKPPKTEQILSNLDRVDESINQLSDVLDKIKMASQAPGRSRRIVSLREIWEQARSQANGRLNVAAVGKVNFTGSDADIDVSPDWFRQVFLNLLLNSTDAFLTNGGPRMHRSIQLQMRKAEYKSNAIVMRYTDNAGGINFAGLRSVNGEPLTKPPEQAIFEPNVTSKPDGSGWGLALVRRILSQYGGGIDLVDHRGGVSFDIRLPKPHE